MKGHCFVSSAVCSQVAGACRIVHRHVLHGHDRGIKVDNFIRPVADVILIETNRRTGGNIVDRFRWSGNVVPPCAGHQQPVECGKLPILLDRVLYTPHTAGTIMLHRDGGKCFRSLNPLSDFHRKVMAILNMTISDKVFAFL